MSGCERCRTLSDVVAKAEAVIAAQDHAAALMLAELQRLRTEVQELRDIDRGVRDWERARRNAAEARRRDK